MTAKCCTKEPILGQELLDNRNQAVSIIKDAIDKAAELGFSIHTAYSTENFFIEPLFQNHACECGKIISLTKSKNKCECGNVYSYKGKKL